MSHDPGSISRMLARRIEPLAKQLFPAGRRHGQEFRVGSLAGEAGQSLAIHVGPARPGVWCDFSGGESGDSLDLVAEALFRGDRRAALSWAANWLGLSDDPAAAPARPPAPAADKDKESAGRRTAFAYEVFSKAQPSIADTPAEDYLANRAINIRELGVQPRSLRFHPALDCVEAGRKLPAMVAAISGPQGEFIGLHRTWLQPGPHGWGKAALGAPKKVLGSVSGGAIRLWRGASDKALADAPDGDELVLTEGIETGLSIAMACPEKRVMAVASIGNMAAQKLPAAIKTVTISADNDAPDSPATKALQRAIDKFVREGRRVRVARSPIGSDFNDALTARGI